MSKKKVVLVTGASSGIGLTTALSLLTRGHIVYGGARRVDAMGPITDAGGHALALDVTDDASMEAAVAAVLEKEGRIDVLINNAGYGSYGAVEDIPISEARQQIEVNIFGLARMTQLVLPAMRAQGAGRIVNVSSIGGTIWTPLGAWYHATKWAVEGFTNTMRLEVEPFAIHMVLIAPGAIATEFNGVITEKMEAASGSGPYAPLVSVMKAAASAEGSNPKVIADLMVRAVEDARPRPIYRGGQYGYSLPILARFLPKRWFDGIVRRAMGLNRAA